MTLDIQTIENGINTIVDAVPQLSGNAENAMSAIRASWDRAHLGEKRLANTARHNIASYVMGFVAAAYNSGKLKENARESVRNLVNHATSIEAKPSERHEPIEYVPPGSWKGKAGGPWKRKIENDIELTLNHVPNLPGGAWTICIQGVPCLFGNDPGEVEAKTLDLLIKLGISRPVRYDRRAISWS